VRCNLGYSDVPLKDDDIIQGRTTFPLSEVKMNELLEWLLSDAGP
jgi:hypothetical protein